MGKRSHRRKQGRAADLRGYCTTSVTSKTQGLDALRPQHNSSLQSTSKSQNLDAHASVADEQRQERSHHEIASSCSTASTHACHDEVSTGLDCEFQSCAVAGATGTVTQIKVIFLDIDGPLVPWTNGKPHQWRATDTLDDVSYVQHVDALQRIINAAGGPEIVKIVISSNWRTDEERYPWLVSKFASRGIDVIGHTDVTNLRPKICQEAVLERGMEIHRVLNTRVLGDCGARSTSSGSLAFTPATLSDAYDIMSWIAIDDLPLDNASLWLLDHLEFVGWQIAAPDDTVVTGAWTQPADDFANNFAIWSDEFAEAHFVEVDEEAGLAWTPEAESIAVQLLNISDRA